MSDLRYTLVSDGSSDAALIPILTWLLLSNGVRLPVQPAWADLGRLRRPPKTLAERIRLGFELYPCDLLFVHRDAENQGREARVVEIEQAIAEVVRAAGHEESSVPSHVCVVPVRMTEAWLLIDQVAIRHAAGNASGSKPLELPGVETLETLPDPKETLYGLLRDASGLSGRRLQNFAVGHHAHRVSTFISDFSPLRPLQAFQALEVELSQVVRQRQWDRVKPGVNLYELMESRKAP
jgi:hypothetical protein